MIQRLHDANELVERSLRGARGFRQYQATATQLAVSLLNQTPKGAFDELALPAYSHRNPLMRWLFWQRLWTVLQYVERLELAGRKCLDFGCGVGVLIPLLNARGLHCSGADVELRYTATFLRNFGLENTPCFGAESLRSLSPASFDVITALDVLEHVDDLEGNIRLLLRLLRPQGRLIICGPTENILYKLGRYFAGFDGHYHVRNIYDIRSATASLARVESIATLYYPAPLFHIFAAIQ